MWNTAERRLIAPGRFAGEKRLRASQVQDEQGGESVLSDAETPNEKRRERKSGVGGGYLVVIGLFASTAAHSCE
jgi:hypothetical protein